MRPAFVAIVTQERLDFTEGGCVQDVSRGSSADPHPHVEHGPGTEGKSSRFLVQLPGGYAEIQQDKVRRKVADCAQCLG
jgi:hypothetical protein